MADAIYVFDFDSTLVRVETLEVLADIALEGSPDAAAVRTEIARLTDQAMAGDLPFGEALRRRLALLPSVRRTWPSSRPTPPTSSSCQAASARSSRPSPSGWASRPSGCCATT